MYDKPHASLKPLLRKLSSWAELDDEDCQSVLALPYETKRVARHSYIAREGERTTQSCVLLSGYAVRQKIVCDGGRQIFSIHMKGDLVDLQNSFLGVADHSVQVLTDCEAAFIPSTAIKALAFERPRVGMALWLDSLVDAAVFREWIANVGRRNAATRVAHLLCEFSLRLEVAGLGELTQYELPMTQEQLGDCTGLTSVHVNRTLKALEADNLIERRSSRSIIVADWRKLAQAGDFDSAYLHLDAKNEKLSV